MPGTAVGPGPPRGHSCPLRSPHPPDPPRGPRAQGHAVTSQSPRSRGCFWGGDNTGSVTPAGSAPRAPGLSRARCRCRARCPVLVPGGGRRVPPPWLCPHQEFPFLLPVAALGVGAAVRLRHHVDQLPLLGAGAGAVLQRFDHLLLAPPLPVLLDQLPLRYPLRVVQHHCRGCRQWGRPKKPVPTELPVPPHPQTLLGAPSCSMAPPAVPSTPNCPRAAVGTPS